MASVLTFWTANVRSRYCKVATTQGGTAASDSTTRKSRFSITDGDGRCPERTRQHDSCGYFILPVLRLALGGCELRARGPIRFCYLHEMMFVVRREPSEELAREFQLAVDRNGKGPEGSKATKSNATPSVRTSGPDNHAKRRR